MAVGNHDEESLDIRVSNADRDQVVGQLRQHVADGRLTLDEFSDRMTEVFDARTRRDLDQTLRNLPAPPPDPAEVRAAKREERRSRMARRRKDAAGFVMPNAICITVWAATSGVHSYFWPGWVLFGTGIAFAGKITAGESRHERRRRRLKALGRELAAIQKQGAAHGHRPHQAHRTHQPRLGEHPGMRPPASNGTHTGDADWADGGTTERVVSTVLFVDIVGSTERAVAMGDAGWRELLDEHERMVAKELEHWQGHKVFTKGDEVVATFDTPARAVHCACAIRTNTRTLGLEVRAGIHAGEVDRRGDDVSGIALHIGQRVSSRAEPGDVLVSSTVKELLAGSGIAFEDRGVQPLKGVPDEWRLYAVAMN